ncbi:MAG: hypothetical protein Tsb0013_23300 [Phycisphaerales bacterium]
MLSELLTDPPRSFIFREPGIARGRYELHPDDIDALRPFGGRPGEFKLRWSRWLRRRVARNAPSRFVRAFRDELIAPLADHIEQLGVKEIAHEGWQRYADAFPDMRVIVLGRDPRDIYLSMLDRRRKGVGQLKGETLTPRRAAELLLPEFEHQLEMAERLPTLNITYERLCTDPSAFDDIRTHVDSPQDRPGDAGRFNEANPQRRDEAAIHHGTLTNKRTDRWRRVDDEQTRDACEQLFEHMRAYAEYWGYPRD